MSKNDQSHFETYTPQNRIKHEILGKYFSAYMRALGRSANAYHYVDGFAGPGLYEGKIPGSPLIALAILSKQSLPWTVSFVEADGKLFSQLVGAILKHPATEKMFEPPILKKGEFAQFVDGVLSRAIYTKFNKVATFAFIDPCGASGMHMRDVARLMSQDYGECLLFWNYDGINRWLGGVAAGSHDISGVVDLFGNEALVRTALQICEQAPPDKERRIRDIFIKAVTDYSGAGFVLPFRFQAKGAEKTSHYLVHCSGHSLAFKIMKDVMDGASSSDEGTFEFLSDADTNYQLGIFRPHIDSTRAEILNRLKHGITAVRVFTDEWVRRPHDLISSNGYKRILLDLEEHGEIEVLDKTGTEKKPRDKRRKHEGTPTLGADCMLRYVRSIH